MTPSLTLFDRVVKAPLGLLWFLVMMIVGVPVILYMTGLFFALQGLRALRESARRGGRGAGAPGQEA